MIGLAADRRVNDRRRAAAAAMLATLLRQAAQRLAVDDPDDDALNAAAAWLMKEDRDLVAMLGAQVDEHLFATRLMMRARMAADLSHEFAAVDPLEALMTRDEPVSAAARALLDAEARRLDAFGEPTIDFDALPRPMRARLIWSVAAAARPEDNEAHDQAAFAAVDALDNDQPDLLDRESASLVAALEQAGSDRWLAGDALAWGHVAFAAALISRCMGVPGAIVRATLVAGVPEDVVAIARSLTGTDSFALASLILTIAQGRCGDPEGAGVVAQAWLALASQNGAAEVDRRLRVMALPDGYRSALAGLGVPC